MSKVILALYRCLVCRFESKRNGVRETICPFCHKPMSYITTTSEEQD